MSSIVDRLRIMGGIDTSALYSQRKTLNDAADEIDRLRLAITNAQNNAGNTYQAAKAEISKARRQAFIEAAEIADRLEDIEACTDERSIGASQALVEIASALRAKAEDS